MLTRRSALPWRQVLGVHMRTSDEQPNQLVKNWNVQKYVFSKEKVWPLIRLRISLLL